MGSEAAAALAKIRWSKSTAEERKAHATMMAQARWGKKKKGQEREEKKPAKA